jgi:hypothetical protein
MNYKKQKTNYNPYTDESIIYLKRPPLSEKEHLVDNILLDYIDRLRNDNLIHLYTHHVISNNNRLMLRSPTIKTLRFACNESDNELIEKILDDPRLVLYNNNNDSNNDSDDDSNDSNDDSDSDNSNDSNDNNNYNDVFIYAMHVVSTFQLLLRDKRFDPSYNNNCVLKEACKRKRLDIIKVLLDDERVSITAEAFIEAMRDATNLIPAFIARRDYQSTKNNIIELLLNDPRITINDNVLEEAIYLEHFNIVKKLFKKIKNLNVSLEAYLSSFRTNNLDLFYYIQKKSPYFDIHQYIFGALITSVVSKHHQIFDILIGRIDLYKRTTGKKVDIDVVELFNEAASFDNKHVMTYLLKNESFYNVPFDDNLMGSDDPQIVEMILQNKNIQIEWIDKEGSTVQSLSCAIYHKKYNIVKALLKDPRVNIHFDASDIFYCAMSTDDVKMIELIIGDPRIDPTIDDNKAIHDCSDFDIAKVLLQWNRSSNVSNNDSNNVSNNNNFSNIKFVDPRVDNNYIIINAISFNDKKMIDLLYHWRSPDNQPMILDSLPLYQAAYKDEALQLVLPLLRFKNSDPTVPYQQGGSVTINQILRELNKKENVYHNMEALRLFLSYYFEHYETLHWKNKNIVIENRYAKRIISDDVLKMHIFTQMVTDKNINISEDMIMDIFSYSSGIVNHIYTPENLMIRTTFG